MKPGSISLSLRSSISATARAIGRPGFSTECSKSISSLVAYLVTTARRGGVCDKSSLVLACIKRAGGRAKLLLSFVLWSSWLDWMVEAPHFVVSRPLWVFAISPSVSLAGPGLRRAGGSGRGTSLLFSETAEFRFGFLIGGGDGVGNSVQNLLACLYRTQLGSRSCFIGTTWSKVIEGPRVEHRYWGLWPPVPLQSGHQTVGFIHEEMI